MEELIYLSIRFAGVGYLLYKVWGQKQRMQELCSLLYTPVKKEKTEVALAEVADETDVMGKSRFVYLDENAGETVAPYMSQPLEMGTNYIGEEDEIPEEEVECKLSLEEMKQLKEEQEQLDEMSPEVDAVTQVMTLDDLSLAGDVLMKVNGADEDEEKVCRAARTLFAIRNTCLFDIFTSQVGNVDVINRLLDENLDENGHPLVVKKGNARHKPDYNWKELV